MTDVESSLDPPANPFSARFLQPGTIPFLFHDEGSFDDVRLTLQQNGWRGEIVGPHGSGKSTLLVRLGQHLESVLGFDVRFRIVHKDDRDFTKSFFAMVKRPDFQRRVVWLVDGFEQLSWWKRRRMRRASQSSPIGFIVTTHQTQGFPSLYHTSSSIEMCKKVVSHLAPRYTERFSDAVIVREFRLAENNIRETLFRLYDIWEASANLSDA